MERKFISVAKMVGVSGSMYREYMALNSTMTSSMLRQVVSLRKLENALLDEGLVK